jgi:hypothetical protein
MNAKYPPRVVVMVAGASADALRQWRARGYLARFGERAGAATCYSRAEVLQIALVKALAGAGFGLCAAFEIVADPPPEIVAALAGQGEALTFWRPCGNADEPAKLVVDAAAIVRAAAARLDAALDEERSRRRPSFGRSLPSAHQHA